MSLHQQRHGAGFEEFPNGDREILGAQPAVGERLQRMIEYLCARRRRAAAANTLNEPSFGVPALLSHGNHGTARMLAGIGITLARSLLTLAGFGPGDGSLCYSQRLLPVGLGMSDPG
jgi:hypothetical protein